MFSVYVNVNNIYIYISNPTCVSLPFSERYDDYISIIIIIVIVMIIIIVIIVIIVICFKTFSSQERTVLGRLNLGCRSLWTWPHLEVDLVCQDGSNFRLGTGSRVACSPCADSNTHSMTMIIPVAQWYPSFLYLGRVPL